MGEEKPPESLHGHPDGQSDARNESVEAELLRTQEQLRATIAELEVSNKELRSTNEEADRKLARSHNLSQHVQRAAKIGVFEWDVVADRFEWSEEVGRLLDIKVNQAEAPRTTFIEFVPEVVRGMLRDALDTALRTGVLDLSLRIPSETLGPRMMAFKGELEFTETSDSDTLDAEVRKPGKLLGTIQDVTELSEVKSSLGQTQKRLQSLLNDSGVGVYLYDISSGRNVYINEHYTEITGYTLTDLQALTSQDFLGLFHPEDLERLLDHMSEVVSSAEGTLFELVYRFKHKQGHWIWCHSQDTILDRTETGDASTFLGAFLDVGFDVDAGHASLAQDPNSLAFKHTGNLEGGTGVAILSNDGKTLVVNQALCNLLEYRASELKETRFRDLAHPDDVEKELIFYRNVVDGERDTYELPMWFTKKSGAVICLQVRATAVRSSAHEVSTIILTFKA